MGIFGTYLDLPNPRGLNDGYNRLHELGAEIEALRSALGMPEYELYTRYKAYCGRRGANDPGEPRLAQELLKELDASITSAE